MERLTKTEVTELQNLITENSENISGYAISVVQEGETNRIYSHMTEPVLSDMLAEILGEVEEQRIKAQEIEREKRADERMVAAAEEAERYKIGARALNNFVAKLDNANSDIDIVRTKPVYGHDENGNPVYEVIDPSFIRPAVLDAVSLRSVLGIADNPSRRKDN